MKTNERKKSSKCDIKPSIQIEVLKDKVKVAGIIRVKGAKLSVSAKTFESLDSKDVKKVVATK